MIKIRFRAWSIEDKIMFDFALPSWNGSVEVWENNVPQTKTIFYSQNGPVDEAVLMQYTGLKDKNGKEIYAGDVLKHTNPHKGFLHDGNQLFLVEWVHINNDDDNQLIYCGWKFVRKNQKGFTTHYAPEKDLEIIGNIYENPELLADDTDKALK